MANREIHITTQLINQDKFNILREIIYSEAKKLFYFNNLYKEIYIITQHINEDKFAMFREIIYIEA